MVKEIQINVEKAKLGDEEAKEYLIKKFLPLFYKMMKFLPSYKRDREELIQESSLILLESIKKYDPFRGVPFEAYIRNQIKFLYYDKLKKKEENYSLDTGWEEGNAFIDTLLDEERIEDMVELKEELILLNRAISKLTNKQQKVVVDFYIKRRSIKEIAREMGCSYSVAIKHKQRAINKLKTLLGNKLL